MKPKCGTGKDLGILLVQSLVSEPEIVDEINQKDKYDFQSTICTKNMIIKGYRIYLYPSLFKDHN